MLSGHRLSSTGLELSMYQKALHLCVCRIPSVPFGVALGCTVCVASMVAMTELRPLQNPAFQGARCYCRSQVCHSFHSGHLPVVSHLTSYSEKGIYPAVCCAVQLFSHAPVQWRDNSGEILPTEEFVMAAFSAKDDGLSDAQVAAVWGLHGL